ncbi:CoA transferase [Brachybacterium endophyticum]|uniref:CoA transferase n=1 Tax=Brachybacterium endophyticum TaxID=2182385 RepID=A0A2U2RJR0_9MICO|nr:CoA transferase [Brachybacterium endophyticum]PWH06035.1 CoA transferase [Brachybacterium endophyticum]
MASPVIPAWSGPLDVGFLAMQSVSRAVDATRSLARARGLDVQVDTTPALVESSYAAIDHLRVDGTPVEAWGPLSGFFAAADGWVRLHGNYPHHLRAIASAVGTDAREGVTASIERTSADEVVKRVLEAGGIATRVRTPQEWAEHPQARAMADELWWQVEVGEAREDPITARASHGRSGRAPAGAPSLPLTGVRVLDLTRVVAGPMATQLLACLGADVLRVDPPSRPELLDAYLASGMGKRSVAADLGAISGSGELDALLAAADVVVLGYRPGSLARFGLAPETLRERHPHLVIGSLSAWGEAGPWGERAGFDSIVQAATGIGVVFGSEGSSGNAETGVGKRPGARGPRPGALPVQALDHSTGYVLAAGIIDLLAAGRSGIVRAHLLGAARELLSRFVGRGSDGSGLDDVPAGTSATPTTITQQTPHGTIATVPVPVRVGGTTLTGPIREYGGADLSWTTP